jgi:hypothetical protein
MVGYFSSGFLTGIVESGFKGSNEIFCQEKGIGVLELGQLSF